jgi:hypothetical protein
MHTNGRESKSSHRSTQIDTDFCLVEQTRLARWSLRPRDDQLCLSEVGEGETPSPAPGGGRAPRNRPKRLRSSPLPSYPRSSTDESVSP